MLGQPMSMLIPQVVGLKLRGALAEGGNMSPEYGSTCAIFPIDDETLDYLRLTGRPEHQIKLVEAYAKEQGLWHRPDHVPDYSEIIELDLTTIVPSIAGPKRPQNRIPLGAVSRAVRGLLSGEAQEETVQEGPR
jgi:aconitate hydratase